MCKHFFKAIAVIAITGFLSFEALAQPENVTGKLRDNDEIIIKKKGDKDTKVTVEINDGEVKVNGKPLSEFDDNNVIILKRPSNPLVMAYGTPRSPFRGASGNITLSTSGNRALLGVLTAKAENGVSISSVTKGSAAEKAGLKENDVITRVDETAVTSPEDLTKAIGKLKPEDKTVISYKRGNKDQKVTVVLGKRNDATASFNENQEWFNGNQELFNGSQDLKSKAYLDMLRPKLEGFNFFNGNPRLGIKAQDTEEGKGVKVLEVDDESNAKKAGVKEGDIITDFNGKTVNSANELADAAREAKDKSQIKIKYQRDGKSQEMDIKIPRKLKTASL